MSGYALYGVNYYPAGWISGLSYVRFRGMGKQWDLEPPAREPPLVLHSGVASLLMEGVVVTEPLTGKFFECTKVFGYMGASNGCNTANTAKTVRDSVFVGTNVEFTPAPGVTDVAERNLFFGGYKGARSWGHPGCLNARVCTWTLSLFLSLFLNTFVDPFLFVLPWRG